MKKVNWGILSTAKIGREKVIPAMQKGQWSHVGAIASRSLAQAQKDTGNLLRALRAHMGQAVAAGTDMSAAIKRFDTAPYRHLKHVEVWLPQIANLTYLEMEQE